MQYLEKVVHPRWPTVFEAAKHFVGVVVLLLTAALLLTPVPLSNIAPAIVIALISLAYLEEDGLLLCFGLLAAVVLISVASAAVWGAIVGAAFISTHMVAILGPSVPIPFLRFVEPSCAIGRRGHVTTSLYRFVEQCELSSRNGEHVLGTTRLLPTWKVFRNTGNARNYIQSNAMAPSRSKKNVE
jgi:Exopolysaccharide synthesis, ExoD